MLNASGENSRVVYVENLRLDSGGADRFALQGIEPPPVETFTIRPTEAGKLLDALLSTQELASNTIALEGMGGVGKSTLAAHCVRNILVQERFPGGIYWLSFGRDKQAERLSSYLCEVVQALTGSHYSVTDLHIAASGFIDALSTRKGNVLVVTDDVWTNEQIQPLLRGGSNITRLVLSRNRLGALGSAKKIELGMMSDHQAMETLIAGIPAAFNRGLELLVSDLARFSRGWPVLLAILGAALRSNIESGANIPEVASWIQKLLERGGPAALDDALPESVDQSVEATIMATLELIDENDRELYYALCIFAEDATIPDHLITLYWNGLRTVPDAQARRLLAQLSQLRLIDLRWADGVSGRVIHDVLRDYMRHSGTTPSLEALNNTLVQTWQQGLVGQEFESEWWRVSPAEQFVYEHLTRHLVDSGRAKERRELLLDLRWLAAQTSSLGSVVHAIADLRTCKGKQPSTLVATLERHGSIIQRESSPGGLASTLLSAVSATPGLSLLAGDYAATLEWPTLRHCWPTQDVAPTDVPGHVGPIGDIALSPNGESLASASDDKLVLIWDMRRRVVRRRLVGHRERVRSCSFSPNGQYLLTSGMDGTARIWDADTGASVSVLGRDEQALLGSCWSGDGTFIAGSFADGRTVVWTAADGDIVADLDTDQIGATWDCQFIDGNRLLTAGDDGHLRVWTLASQDCVLDLEVHSTRIRRCSVNRQTTMALTASGDGTVGIVTLHPKTQIRFLEGHQDRLRSAVFSPDGDQILTASEDRTIRLWDSERCSEIAVIGKHSDWVGRAIFDTNQSRVLSAGGDATIRSWLLERPPTPDNLTTGYEQEFYLPGGENETASCCFSPSGEEIYYGKVSRTQRRNQLGALLSEYSGHFGRVLDVAATHDRLYTCSSDGTVKSWQLSDDSMEAQVKLDSRVWSLDIISSTGDIVSAAEDGRVRIHSGRSLDVTRQTSSVYNHVQVCKISPDEEEIIFAGDGGSLQLGLVRNFPVSIGNLPVGDFRSLWSAEYSHNGLLVALAGEPAAETLILKANSWEQHVVLDTRVGRVTSVSFNLDDSIVATCGDDGYVGIWDVESGAAVTGFRLHFPVRRSVWSPADSTLLAVAGSGGEYLFRLVT